jgi:hypothetical protein
MAQSDQLRASMAQLSTDLDNVATGINTQIQQLRDKLASGQDLEGAVNEAITGLEAAHTRLVGLSSALAADDPANPSGS